MTKSSMDTSHQNFKLREDEGVEIISLTNDYVDYLSMAIQKEATKNVRIYKLNMIFENYTRFKRRQTT
jgi:hypothetical protein